MRCQQHEIQGYFTTYMCMSCIYSHYWVARNQGYLLQCTYMYIHVMYSHYWICLHVTGSVCPRSNYETLSPPLSFPEGSLVMRAWRMYIESHGPKWMWVVNNRNLALVTLYYFGWTCWTANNSQHSHVPCIYHSSTQTWREWLCVCACVRACVRVCVCVCVCVYVCVCVRPTRYRYYFFGLRQDIRGNVSHSLFHCILHKLGPSKRTAAWWWRTKYVLHCMFNYLCIVMILQKILDMWLHIMLFCNALLYIATHLQAVDLGQHTHSGRLLLISWLHTAPPVSFYRLGKQQPFPLWSGSRPQHWCVVALPG